MQHNYNSTSFRRKGYKFQEYSRCHALKIKVLEAKNSNIYSGQEILMKAEIRFTAKDTSLFILLLSFCQTANNIIYCNYTDKVLIK